MQAGWISIAKSQKHFSDEAPTTAPGGFGGRPEFDEARRELFCTFQWLKTLLQGGGEVAVVRERVAAMSGLLTDYSGLWTDARSELYGRGKRDLLSLCEALEQDPRPSTVAAACRELRLAFCASGGHDEVSPADAITGALGQVCAEGGERRRRRQAAESSTVSAATVVAASAASSDAGAPARSCPSSTARAGTVHPASHCAATPLWETVQRLAVVARGLGLRPDAALDAFLARWLGQSPTGGQDDPFGNLQLFGVDALARLLARATAPGVARDDALRVLGPLIGGLSKKTDPAAEILRVERDELLPARQTPAATQSAHRARSRVIDDAVRLSGEPLLQDLPPEDRDALLRAEAMAVKDRLGIDYDVGGISDGPAASGLFDTSAGNLLKLLKACDQAAERVYSPYSAA
ncbi:hypothetical protein CDN99_19295 [Roseateles aquatilis]|uniref:Uncharacterized protein n=1 Tax=Roseateles aquatilis TaxID=431061 RepID=A0A246J2M8_9BURK|nr:hypothetical protein CDN99_19295 [Roseateles aquatilis]